MMLRHNQKPVLRVLVSVPSGVFGQGGIDRVMGALMHELERQRRDDVDVRFLASRGSGHVAWSLFHALNFCVRMIAGRLAGKVDVVHLNVSNGGSTYRKMIIAACARLMGVPYVVHLHSGQYPEFWTRDNRLRNRLIRRMFGGAKRIVVLGKVWRAFVESRAPEVSPVISIIQNASASPALPRVGGGDVVHILFLGRITPLKGTPQLFDALDRIRDLPAWRATIAGDGDVDHARAQTNALGLSSRIDIPGWVGPDIVASLLSSADILVLPSFVENLPVSVIEGMANSLAIVTTPVGAVEDIITDGVSGIIVPIGDAAALADALTRLIEDRDLRLRLGSAALAVHRERLELAPFADALCATWKAAALKDQGPPIRNSR
jgi:glycosyltransferase involved in cell wall biosynthesis